MNGLAVKLQNEIKRVCIGWESKDVKDLMPYVTHCSSLIERRHDETDEAKLMLAQVNGKVNGPVGEMRGIMRTTDGRTITVADHNTETCAERSVVRVGNQVTGPGGAGTAGMVGLMVRTDR